MSTTRREAEATPPSTPGRFAGRRAIVTGSASGIGRAAAARLAVEGARVVGLDRSPGSEATHIQVDLSIPAQVESGVDAALRRLEGTPDVLVQAAGIYRSSPIVDCDTDLWDTILGTNLRAQFLVARQIMRMRDGATSPLSIINVASTAGRRGLLSEPAAAYNASKAGVLALTRQMAAEWAPFGVRANAVLPGFTDTPMVRIMDDPVGGRSLLDGCVPMRRMGSAEECAATICFLASDEAAYTTGAELVVDGGLLLSLGPGHPVTAPTTIRGEEV